MARRHSETSCTSTEEPLRQNKFAMPLGMGRMMRLIGRAPEFLREPMFTAMAPLMPRLFPILLPGMMPKVLPQMIRLVEESIEMPEYLRSQLPDLFPQVVDNVMPITISLVCAGAGEPGSARAATIAAAAR